MLGPPRECPIALAVGQHPAPNVLPLLHAAGLLPAQVRRVCDRHRQRFLCRHRVGAADVSVMGGVWGLRRSLVAG